IDYHKACRHPLNRDEDSSTTPAMETNQFIESGVDDLVPIPKEVEETSDDDSVCNMLDISLPTTDVIEDDFVTFSNPPFNTSCYDNPLFDKEFEDISSLDLIEFTLIIDETPLLVIQPPASKQFSLREVDRFDPFFSLTQSDGTTRVMETPSFGFYHMPSPCPATYSPKEVMYRFYHTHHTSGDGFNHKSESKEH
nr:hypothetical protein [Tanacetum cinerariifolium]